MNQCCKHWGHRKQHDIGYKSRPDPFGALSEAGAPGFEGSSWFGMVAPRNTPPAIIARLNKEFVRIMHLPDISAQFASEGAEPVADTPEEFAAKMRVEIAKWGKLIKTVGIVADQ